LIQVIPIRISANIKREDDLASIISKEVEKAGIGFLDGDILVVAHKAVSKAEGRILDLGQIVPSRRASTMARIHHKDPRLVEIILKESRRIVRASRGVIITETRHGFICANSGVDQSNIEGDNLVILLPLNPDKSASRLRSALKEKHHRNVVVIITDTFGRPFRNGQTNVAIGAAGIDPIKSYIGTSDMYGKKLRVTEIAIADEIASAAELVMGKTEWVPAAIVRGYIHEGSQKSDAKTLLREKRTDLFR
jgi:coenzyme F420-0:L-glutamate ligase/coenzyme F420-1:gamma-L-glutamate ligase